MKQKLLNFIGDLLKYARCSCGDTYFLQEIYQIDLCGNRFCCGTCQAKFKINPLPSFKLIGNRPVESTIPLTLKVGVKRDRN